MKKIDFLKIVALALILSSCGTSKKTVGPEPAGFGTEVVMPCVDESYDNADYFRGLGTGTSVNIGDARTASMNSAKSEIKAKLGGFVSGLTSDYSKTISGGSGEKTQRIMEGELFAVVNKLLDDAEKVCEKTTQDQRGTFNSFIVFQIPKKDMITEMENSLSENEELKAEFSREQFRKFAKEKMEEMQNAKKNQ